MIKTLTKYADVTLIKGNHDGNLERLIPGTPIKTALKIGDLFLVHGHIKIPRDQDFAMIIAGHSHPCVKFRDSFKSTKESAGIKTHINCSPAGEKNSAELIIMPAFNELIYSTPHKLQKKLLGPLFKLIDLADADAYLLDGAHLKIRDIS